MAKKDWPRAWLAGVDRFSTAVGTKTNICLGHIPRIFPANGRHMWWIAECRISANMCKYCKGSIGIIWRFWLFVVQSSFDFCHHCWPVRCPSNSPVPWSMTLGVIGKIVPWYWWVGFPRIVIVPTINHIIDPQGLMRTSHGLFFSLQTRSGLLHLDEWLA